MDRIAIISDIHGNLEALNKVISDIESRNINKIYCLGDILAKGTHQQECLDILRDKCEVIIQGNCDEIFTTDFDQETLERLNASEQEIKRIEWNRTKINDESREYIRSLPFCYEFYMSGRLIRLLHAHPERNEKFVGNIDSLTNFYSLVLPSDKTISQEKADVVICGHIHTPYVQKIYNRYIINAGSVGNAFDVFRNPEKDANKLNTTVANYVILSGNLDSKNYEETFSFELVSVPYDIDKELADNDDNIELDSYSVELKNGMYRDMEKIYRSFEARGIKREDI